MILAVLLENNFGLRLCIIIVVSAASRHVECLIQIFAVLVFPAQLCHVEALFQIGVLFTVIYVLVILTRMVILI